MCLNQMKGMTSSKSTRPTSRTSVGISRPSSNTRSEHEIDGEEPPLEVTSVSYLTVPHTPPDPRRPSTADVFIERLKVERMEGGGLSISGVALASNCHLSLIIFGAFFLMAGIVLTYVGFARSGGAFTSSGIDGGARQAARTSVIQTHGNMKVIGPSFVLAGLLMLLLGFALFGLSKKIQKDEKEQRKALSELQLCQMESNFKSSTSPPTYTTAPAANEPFPILSVRRGSYWMDSTAGEPPYSESKGTPVEPQVPPISSRATSPLPNNYPLNDWGPHHGEVNTSQDTFSSPRTPRHPPNPWSPINHAEYYHTDIATFPHEDIGESRVPTAVQHRRDIDQQIPYEYYQPHYPVTLQTQHSLTMDQPQQDALMQYQQRQLQKQHSRDQQQWRGSAGSRHVPQIQVTSATPSTLVLPRLSRHSCSSGRPESQQQQQQPSSTSRPTTAEAR